MLHLRQAGPINLASRIRRLGIAAVLGALLAGIVATGASAAPIPLTFEIGIGDGCVYGTARADSFIKVVVRDAGGRLQGRGFTQVWEGYWEYCQFYGVIRPGHTIKATVFNETGTLQVRTVTVPRLSIRVNRDTDVVAGKAPAGSRVQISVADYRWDYWGQSYDASMDVAVNGAGAYSYNFGLQSIDISGGASAQVSWWNASRTSHVYRNATAPSISLMLGGPEFAGATRLNKAVSVTLSDGASADLATGHAVGDWMSGAYWGLFSDDEDELYDVRGGEWLTAPAIGPDVDWRIPTGVGKVDTATDRVSGKCFPNGRYSVFAASPDWGYEGEKYGTASASGSFTRDMTSLVNIKRNSPVQVVCWTASGDAVTSSVTVP